MRHDYFNKYKIIITHVNWNAKRKDARRKDKKRHAKRRHAKDENTPHEKTILMR